MLSAILIRIPTSNTLPLHVKRWSIEPAFFRGLDNNMTIQPRSQGLFFKLGGREKQSPPGEKALPSAGHSTQKYWV